MGRLMERRRPIRKGGGKERSVAKKARGGLWTEGPDCYARKRKTGSFLRRLYAKIERHHAFLEREGGSRGGLQKRRQSQARSCLKLVIADSGGKALFELKKTYGTKETSTANKRQVIPDEERSLVQENLKGCYRNNVDRYFDIVSQNKTKTTRTSKRGVRRLPAADVEGP